MRSAPPRVTRRVVVLDFDGVICDSIEECMLTAFTAYAEMERGAPTSSAEMLDPQLADAFRRMRYLVRPAREYWLLVHHLLTTQASREDLQQAEFDDLAKQYERSLAVYEAIFFRARRRMQQDAPERWLALHGQYPQAVLGLRELCDRHSVHVATTKDRVSVEHLISEWDLRLDAPRLWTHESGVAKPDAVRRIAASENQVPRSVHFVDDHPSHLTAVASTGATCYWASWGYTPRLDDAFGGAVIPLRNLKELSEILDTR